MIHKKKNYTENQRYTDATNYRDELSCSASAILIKMLVTSHAQEQKNRFFNFNFNFFIHSDTYTSATRGILYKLFYIMMIADCNFIARNPWLSNSLVRRNHMSRKSGHRKHKLWTIVSTERCILCWTVATYIWKIEIIS